MRAFRLLLPGATPRDRLLACAGAGLGVAAAGAAGALLASAGGQWLAAPIGASAVLVFAVPASPLAQPWPVVGGNLLSAAIGVGVGSLLPWPLAAAGLAVALAILAMSLTRSLHPPGGAAALLCALAAPAAPWTASLPLLIGLNAAVLALAGAAFHRLSGHPYPHRAAPTPPPSPFTPGDVDRALADMGEAFDVSREDLDALLARAAAHAARRRAGAR